ALFSGARDGTRKAGQISVRWIHLFSLWESPSDSRRIPWGCGWNLNWFDVPEVLVRAHFPKNPVSPLAFFEEYRFLRSSFSFPQKSCSRRKETAALLGKTLIIGLQHGIMQTNATKEQRRSYIAEKKLGMTRNDQIFC
ncbi:MAG: hypothetical protein PUJ12_03805, partial [Oscillospiraceae bacterium]|nr:hypothetical protein [Oscillospiraceae bacterium]